MTIQNRTYDLFLAICRCLLPVQCIAQVTIVISGRIFIGIHHHLGTDLWPEELLSNGSITDSFSTKVIPD